MAELKETYTIPAMPPDGFTESVAVLKAAARAHRFLAELKGRAASIPNQGILIDTLALQEAKSSSEIENIVTTQDELFQSAADREVFATAEAKEVRLYAEALQIGFEQLRATNLITANTLTKIF